MKKTDEVDVQKLEIQYDSAMPIRIYTDPEHGLRVEAVSIEEARIKLKQLLSERK